MAGSRKKKVSAAPHAHGMGADGRSGRKTDPKLNRRLPKDLLEVAQALIAMPAPDKTTRRPSARREALVQLKPYILHQVDLGASSSSIAEVIAKKGEIRVSRRYVSDFINLWRGEITATGLERIAPELFDIDATNGKDLLEKALRSYAAENQLEKIAKVLHINRRR